MSVVIMVVVLVAALLLVGAFLGVTASASDVAWISGETSPSAARTAVYRRYLVRHRRHRLVGGIFGTAFAVVVGIRYRGGVTLGIGGEGSPLGDVLYCAVAGVVLGTLSAESFRLGSAAPEARTASLTERPRVLRPDLHRFGRLLMLASVALSLGLAATGNGFAALWIVSCGIVVMAVADATARAIAGRPRPLLSDEAGAVDARIRAFAATSVAHLELAVAVLTTGWVVSETDGLGSGIVDLARFVVVLGALVVTIVLLRRAAPRPDRRRSGVGA